MAHTRHLEVALTIHCVCEHPEMLCLRCGRTVVEYFEHTPSAEGLTLDLDTGEMLVRISRDDREGQLTEIMKDMRDRGFRVTVKGVTFS